MNIPTTLTNQLMLYLKHQANKGDLEAQTLLAQIEQVATLPPTAIQQAMDVSLSDSLELGC
jgi:hypothetical protein